MSKWINLSELSMAIEEEARRLAVNAGIDNPHIDVRIDPPDKTGRMIEVSVGQHPDGRVATTDEVATARGRAWYDN